MMEASDLLAAGLDAMEAGDSRRAADLLTRASGLAGHPWALVEIAGRAWLLADDLAARTAFWRQIHQEVGPLSTEKRYQLGTELLAVGAPEEATRWFASVLTDRPHDPAAISAYASANRSLGALETAWDAIHAATISHPDNATVLLTAAQVRHCQGHLPEAMEWTERALRVRPNHGPTIVQRSLTRLLAGNYMDGWADAEHRQLPTSRTDAKDWPGGELSGSIAVLSEQGIGDLFHFVRYVPVLRERGATRIVVECQPSTVSLLAANGFEAVPRGQVPETDWSVPLMSLPHRLGLGAETRAEHVPYLHVEPPTPRPRSGPLRIGVTWRGSPEFAATYLRDFAPDLLPALTERTGVIWHSMQYGETLPESCHRTSPVVPRGDWLDTAHQLMELDGLVTVDTSMAHLAGAMNRPTAVLLPYAPDWRWALSTDRSGWYPSMHLIRQTRPRDWESVLPGVQAWISRLEQATAMRR